MKWLILGGISLVGVLLVPRSAEAAMKVFTSDGVIQQGDSYDRVEVYDTPPLRTTVDMTGGYVGREDNVNTGLFTYDSSTVNMTGGHAFRLYTHDSSTVNISASGGAGGDLYGETTIAAYESSTINLFKGGTLLGGSSTFFKLRGSSTLNVRGGDVGLLFSVQDSSVVNIYDGGLFDLWITGRSTVNVYGGFVGTFLENYPVASTATVNFYGWGFEYDAEGVWRYLADPAEGWWVSKLTGYGLDGAPITYLGLPDPALNPNIRFIPEPTTVIFVGLGAIGLLTKRRHRVSW